MGKWMRERALIVAIGGLPLAALAACEGDMGGAEEHVGQEQATERGMPPRSDTAGRGEGAETEGTSAQGDRLGP